MRSTAVYAALATAALCGTCLADPLPTRKPGLWEITTITNGGQITAKQCIDAATDNLAYGAMKAQSCTDNRLRSMPDGTYVSEAKCKLGQIDAEGRVFMQGDFQSSAHVESTMTMNNIPGKAEPMTTRTITDTRYIGDCEPGQRPGDMILGNGKVVNVPPIPKK